MPSIHATYLRPLPTPFVNFMYLCPLTILSTYVQYLFPLQGRWSIGPNKSKLYGPYLIQNIVGRLLAFPFKRLLKSYT